MITTLLYNLLMIVVDAGALVVLRRNPTVMAGMKVCFRGLLVGAILAVVLGSLAAQSLFMTFRLMAFGVFCHGPILAAGSAILLRRSKRRAAGGFAALAAVVAAVAVDAFLVEPTWLEVSHVRLSTPKVNRAVRIVVLADLQTDMFGSYEKKVLRRVLAEDPDLILLAGDYLHVGQPARRQLQTQYRRFLGEIGFSAPSGVFAVRGNTDPGGWTEMFDGLPVAVIEETQSCELDALRLTCLGSRDSFNSRLKLRSGSDDRFHVVLGHSPNFALGDVEADLLVAGHTHGGQVRLPLVGPLITLSDVPRSWAAGLTELPGGGTLYVSRGVGMERGSAPRIRFLCRPELVVIDVVPH